MDPRTLPVIVTSGHMIKQNLDVYYPIVSGIKDKEVQRKINNIILTAVNELINEQGYYTNPQTSITGTYEIKLNERNLLSVSIINYAYSGGAHGLTIVKSLNIDTQTGQVYELEDLFKAGSNYVEKLSDIISVQIQQRDMTLLGEFKGIKPDQDFYLTDKALVIYFQLYEITPYVAGFPAFPISVYDIEDIIDENGPLGRLLYTF